MNLYFIVIICTICFFAILALINAMQTRYEARKTLEISAMLYLKGGDDQKELINNIIAKASKKTNS